MGRVELCAGSTKPGEHLPCGGLCMGPCQSWNHTQIVLSTPSHHLRPCCPSPTRASSADLPIVGRQETSSGWLTTAPLSSCWQSSLVGRAPPPLGLHKGLLTLSAQGTEHPWGGSGYRLKASRDRVTISDTGRAGQVSWLWDTWPGRWPLLCSGSSPGLSFHVSWMGQSLYPDRSRQRLLQGSVWGQALAWAGQLPSAGGLHRHRASGVAGWELASCPVLGVAAAGSCPGLTGCSRLTPSVPSLDSGTPGTLELLFLSS